MARRLVEAGVPVINVIFNHNNRAQDEHPGKTDFYGCDIRNDTSTALKGHLLPRFDAGFSALREDLDQRGLLDDTLVVRMGEFGRAPLVTYEPGFADNSRGRKHWSSVSSVVFAGAVAQKRRGRAEPQQRMPWGLMRPCRSLSPVWHPGKQAVLPSLSPTFNERPTAGSDEGKSRPGP